MCYSVTVCLSSFCLLAISDGVAMTFGLLFPAIKHQLGTDSHTTALIGSVHIGFIYFFGPVYTALAYKFGCRAITISGAVIGSMALFSCGYVQSPGLLGLTYGVIAGAGRGMLVATAELSTNQHFDEKRALANAVVFCGSSAGSSLAPFLMSYLLESDSLRAVYFVQAGITLFCIGLGLTFKPTPTDESQKSFLRVLCNTTVLTNWGFWVENMGRALDSLVLSIPSIYIPSLVGKNGLAVSSSLALTVFGLSNLAGRLLSAVADRIAKHVNKVNALLSFGAGASTILLANCQSPQWFYAACGFCGFFTGPIVALMPLTDATIVGKEDISSAMGWSQLVYGATSLLGPPLFGLLVDLYDDYEEPLHYTAATFAMAALFHSLSGYLFVPHLPNESYQRIQTD